MKLTNDERILVRRAVRLAPDAARVLNGRRVNTLTNSELLYACRMLKIDVAAVIAAPVNTSDAITAAQLSHEILNEAPVSYADPDDADPDNADPSDEVAAPGPTVAEEATALRKTLARCLGEGDFDAVNAALETLITDARKPAEVRIIQTAAGGQPGAVVTEAPVPAPARTLGELFGPGALTPKARAMRVACFQAGARTPAVDPKYTFPLHVTEAAVFALRRNRNVWLYGPAGTGKSSFAEQIAARTGRPFFLIPCDDTTEAPELLGMTVPYQGGTRWQDGALTAAIRTPHALILIDEPTVARPGAIMVLQSVLASGSLTIKETGEVVACAEGVRFVAADNTNGTGGGSADGYEGTRRMNRATLDRFASFLRVDYMEPSAEAAVLVSRSGCTPALADILVACAGMTRKARVTNALGLRRLIAWAECLTDGIEPRHAFEFAIANSCAADDLEPTEQACALGLDKGAVRDALAGVARAVPVAPAAPTGKERGSAAADFA